MKSTLLKLCIPLAKPRNALVVLCHQRRGSGTHVRSFKAQRKHDRVNLSRELRND